MGFWIFYKFDVFSREIPCLMKMIKKIVSVMFLMFLLLPFISSCFAVADAKEIVGRDMLDLSDENAISIDIDKKDSNNGVVFFSVRNLSKEKIIVSEFNPNKIFKGKNAEKISDSCNWLSPGESCAVAFGGETVGFSDIKHTQTKVKITAGKTIGAVSERTIRVFPELLPLLSLEDCSIDTLKEGKCLVKFRNSDQFEIVIEKLDALITIEDDEQKLLSNNNSVEEEFSVDKCSSKKALKYKGSCIFSVSNLELDSSKKKFDILDINDIKKLDIHNVKKLEIVIEYRLRDARLRSVRYLVIGGVTSKDSNDSTSSASDLEGNKDGLTVPDVVRPPINGSGAGANGSDTDASGVNSSDEINMGNVVVSTIVAVVVSVGIGFVMRYLPKKSDSVSADVDNGSGMRLRPQIRRDYTE